MAKQTTAELFVKYAKKSRLIGDDALTQITPDMKHMEIIDTCYKADDNSEMTWGKASAILGLINIGELT